MNKRLNIILLTLLALVGVSLPATASYLPFNTNVNMNVGIGTSTPQGAFVVTNGNVGIGTWAPANKLDILNGNVGIGTAYGINIAGTTSPILTFHNDNSSIYAGYQTALTVVGANLQNTAFGTYTLQSINAGGGESAFGFDALNANSGAITGDYNSAFGFQALLNLSSGATNSAFGSAALLNITTSSNDLGLGVQAGEFISGGTNPNKTSSNSTYVGFNTMALADGDINETVIGYNAVGNGSNTVTLGNTSVVTTVLQGNVGIGSLHPGQLLDVQGTVRMTGLTLSQNPGAGYVLVGNGVGVGTWMPASTLTASGGANYWLNDTTGNVGISTIYAVGIGTAFVGGTGEAALSVMNGNVGIGTWVPAYAIDLHDPTGNWAQFADSKTHQEGVAFGSIDSSNGAQIDLQRQDGTTTMTISNANGSVGYAIVDSTNGPLDLNGNNAQLVGIATSSPGSQLSVLGGVSVGSYATKAAPVGGLIVSGNVGIGSLVPGTALDVNGTVRMTGLTLSQNPGAGYVLVGNGVGIGTWMAANTLAIAGSGQWTTINTNDVYETNGGNVGIGTTITNAGAALSVMNGNVGIGTWVPGSALFVNNGVITSDDALAASGAGFVTYAGNGKAVALEAGTSNSNILYDNSGNFSLQAQSRANVLLGVSASTNVTMLIDTNGNVGIGTTAHVAGGLAVMNGNVGIGSLIPGQALDVNGTVRMTGFTLSQNPNTGYVLVGNGVGVGTWMPASTLTASGGTNYWLNDTTGNVGISTAYSVGIGTTLVGGTGEAALSVMNGNVGIGTWVPGAALTVDGSSILGVPASGANSIISSGTGSLAGGTSQNTAGGVGSITSSSNGSFAFGETAGPTGASSILANGNGDIALGYADFNGQTTSISSSGSGSIAMGLAFSGTLQATGAGSVALGENVQANAGNAFALGVNVVNPIADSFMVGFNATPTLTVTGAGVGIGTSSPFGGGLIVTNGNVGIGSLTPGQLLDVQGTIRTTGFTLNFNPSAGYVLVGNGVGVGTWMPASTLTASGGTNYWLNDTSGNVGISTAYAVGIGTTFIGGTGEAALSIMNGNMGIGTWVPGALLTVNGSSILGTTANSTNSITSSGAGSLAGGYAGGTTTSSQSGSFVFGYVQNGTLESTGQGSIAMGSVIGGTGSLISSGTGSIAMGVANANPLSATGTADVSLGEDVQATGTNSIVLGSNVVNSVNNSFMVGFNTAPTLTVTGTGVGIGTINPFGGGLIVLPANTGNVGIGSLTPGQALDVTGTVRTTGFTLNLNPSAGYVLVGNGVGVGTWMPASTLTTSGGTNYWLNDTTGNVGISTIYAVGIGTTFVGGTGEAALSVMNGNVGIGTWMPISAVTIISNTAAGITINNNNKGVNTSAFEQNADGQTYLLADWNISTNTSANISTPSYEIGLQNINDQIIFARTPAGSSTFSNLMTILGTGSVGIGTITPVSQLNVNGGVGIGTTLTNGAYLNGNAAPSGGLIVQGNVGIGTFNPFGGNLIVNGGGNVGIGSLTPGQALDVNGTVRAIGFTMSGQTPVSGYVLTASDSSGDTTWSPSSSVGTNYWLNDTAGNVGISTIYAVGIGTTFVGGTGEASFAVMNGNVGIGTWIPASSLDVEGGNILLSNNGGISFRSVAGAISATNIFSYNQANAIVINQPFTGLGNPISFRVNSNPVMQIQPTGINNFANIGIGTVSPFAALDIVGNIGIGTGINSSYITTTPPSGGMIIQGNVGIGSLTPGQLLDVQGTVRAIGLTMTGQTPISGYVLTSQDSNGDATWSSPGTVGGWTVSGNNVYETSGGNVGIGTTLLTTSALTVMNGNVGIGTWIPGGSLIVKSGNVGIGSDNTPDATLEVTQLSGTPPFMVSSTVTTSGDYLSVINGGNVGIGSTAPGQRLDVQGTVRALGEIVNGNVGIGTALLTTAALTVMNGNVGIGTWIPAGQLDVEGASSNAIFGGNVGIGTIVPVAQLDIVTTSGATTRGEVFDQISNDSNLAKIFLRKARGTPTSPLTVQTADGLASWTSEGYDGTNYDISGRILINSVGTISTGVVPAIMQFQTENSSGTINTGMTLDQNQNLAVSGNVGIGTSFVSSGAALYVMNGNVGIGTWAAGGGNLIVNGGGNVGIGSVWPGTALDVQGTARMTGFILTGNGAAPGSVLVTTAIGMGTWMPINTIAGAGAITSETGPEIAYYSSPFPNQTIVGSPGMEFVAPNVGLGTVTPLATLQVVGNIGIGTVANGDNFIMNSPANGGMIIEGNVGIGTWVPAYNLDLVNGTARQRNVRRVNTEASGSPLTINTDQTDLYTITALAVNLTFSDPTGTPRNGDLLEIRILDNGTARTLTWTAGAGGFASTSTTLPATTVINTTLRILLEYNSASSEWECIGVT